MAGGVLEATLTVQDQVTLVLELGDGDLLEAQYPLGAAQGPDTLSKVYTSSIVVGPRKPAERQYLLEKRAIRKGLWASFWPGRATHKLFRLERTQITSNR